MNKKLIIKLILPIAILASGCAIEPQKVVPEPYILGQASFHKVCANCHGADGMGTNKAPGLIHSKYSDIVNFSIDESKRNNDGQALAIFNSSLNLEIAIYKSNPVNFGTAASLMGLNILDTVTVNFK